MIVPALHRILVKADRLEEVDKTYTHAKKIGLVIPESSDKARAQAGVDTGTVVAIGATAFKDFGSVSPISPGSSVAFARFSGKTITDPYTKEEFVCLNDEDIICVFYEEGALDG